jgi:hypothetical protein
MKKQDITYQDKLNELRLDISHPNNRGTAFVLLEGDSDIRLFRKLFNIENCKVESIPGGKIKLEECVGELTNVYPLIIGIRDADFINLGDQPYSKTNMFLTDFHDMEMMLVSENDVFSALVFEFSSLTQDKHIETRKNIISTIEQISLLKWLNDKENLEYKFEVGFQDLISFANLEIDFNQYFSRVLSKSPNARLTDISTVQEKLAALRESNPNSFQLCNGHDFLKALSQFLREVGDGKALGDDSISSSLRIAFTLEHYKQTTLFSNTKKWSEDNNCSLYA